MIVMSVIINSIVSISISISISIIIIVVLVLLFLLRAEILNVSAADKTTGKSAAQYTIYMADSPDQLQLNTQNNCTIVACALNKTYPINRKHIGVP